MGQETHILKLTGSYISASLFRLIGWVISRKPEIIPGKFREQDFSGISREFPPYN